jgi:hypothetical protein
MTPPLNRPWTQRIPVHPTDPRPILSQIEEALRRLLPGACPGDSVPRCASWPPTCGSTRPRSEGLSASRGRWFLRSAGATAPMCRPPLRGAQTEQTRVIRQAAMNFASW